MNTPDRVRELAEKLVQYFVENMDSGHIEGNRRWVTEVMAKLITASESAELKRLREELGKATKLIEDALPYLIDLRKNPTAQAMKAFLNPSPKKEEPVDITHLMEFKSPEELIEAHQASKKPSGEASRQEVKCPECKGHGRFGKSVSTSYSCPTCKGTGFVKEGE